MFLFVLNKISMFHVFVKYFILPTLVIILTHALHGIFFSRYFLTPQSIQFPHVTTTTTTTAKTNNYEALLLLLLLWLLYPRSVQSG